jgi:hypothetical protein
VVAASLYVAIGPAGSIQRVISDPKAWRGLSSALLVVFIAAAIVGPDIPRWGWFAAIGSGVAFAVELALMARQRRAGGSEGP